MGRGLVTEKDHDVWYLRRKLLDPVFHRNQLRLSVDVFNSTGDQFINSLQKYADSGETFTLSPILHMTTLDVIMKVRIHVFLYNIYMSFCSAVLVQMKLYLYIITVGCFQIILHLITLLIVFLLNKSWCDSLCCN